MTAPRTPLPDLLKVGEERRGWAPRILLISLAAIFFLLGLVGWLMPVVTGIPFYVVSAVLLGMASRRAARWMNQREERLPHKLRVRLRKILRRPMQNAAAAGTALASPPDRDHQPTG